MTRADFEKEVLINREPLRRFLLNLCAGNSSLADDIAQEAFVKAYLNMNTFRGFSKFSTWLFRIAYNCFCDSLKKNSKTQSEQIENYSVISYGESDEKYRHQELYMALKLLNERERGVIILFYMEDKSIIQISKITGIPLNTVKSHLSRARRHLSEYLSKIGYER